LHENRDFFSAIIFYNL
jgi:hypothetical protein